MSDARPRAGLRLRARVVVRTAPEPGVVVQHSFISTLHPRTCHTVASGGRRSDLGPGPVRERLRTPVQQPSGELLDGRSSLVPIAKEVER
ncbi:hypothetical protein STRIP9103_04086 [Streptomyces ipomoeae 91-03]|uniref:Uncharacterized protein n=1 Tax=Streptomyces ipomoeae 91-03 TaxID=698759 RepID=L1L1C9_9ACTN|nr:hypothetical protein STRIP9103_04086 [Streptomyces ipomoeae 91-03]